MESEPVIEQAIHVLTNSPILLLLAAFLLALLAYALVKRLLKLALFAAVFIAVYLGLLYLLGHPLPEIPL
jgi:hypothetical protein